MTRCLKCTKHEVDISFYATVDEENPIHPYNDGQDVYDPRRSYICTTCIDKTNDLNDESRLNEQIKEASLAISANPTSADIPFVPSRYSNTMNENLNRARLEHLGLSCQEVHGEKAEVSGFYANWHDIAYKGKKGHQTWRESDRFISFWQSVPDDVRAIQHQSTPKTRDLKRFGETKRSCEEFHTGTHEEWVKSSQWSYAQRLNKSRLDHEEKRSAQGETLCKVFGAVLLLLFVIKVISECDTYWTS